jgi:hypothetical protein
MTSVVAGRADAGAGVGDVPDSRGVFLYPRRSLAIGGLLLWGLLFLGSAYFLRLALSDIERGTHDASTIVSAAVFAVLTLVFGFMTIPTVRQLVRLAPIMRLDSTGLECQAGAVDWRDVERISADPTFLTVRIRLGVEPRSPVGHYHSTIPAAEAGRWRSPWYAPKSPVTAHGIYVQLGPSKENTLRAVRSFYTGEIGEPLAGDGREPSDGGGA